MGGLGGGVGGLGAMSGPLFPCSSRIIAVDPCDEKMERGAKREREEGRARCLGTMGMFDAKTGSDSELIIVRTTGDCYCGRTSEDC